MLYRVLVLIHSNNVWGKIVSSWCQNFVPVTCLQMDTRETAATKTAEAAAPWRDPGDICALATQRNFLTQEEMVLAQIGLCCLLLPKKREVTHNPPSLFLNGSVHLK